MEYYSYLPALFIHNDLSLDFTKENPEFFSNRFWPHRASNGKLVLKMSSGMAIIYSPFFAMAHLAAKPLGFEPDGFSPPYRIAISFGAILYLAIGLILLCRFLSKYYSPITVSFTLLLTVLATNLWYYSTVEPGMTHVYNFTLFVLFITLLDKWLQSPSAKRSLVLGLLCGIISLIRPTNALIGILFLLWNIWGWNDLRNRIRFLFTKWNKLLIIAIFATLIWVPQMIYWKMQTGQLFYYSYSDQGFFFLSPHITDGLFNFRKGWLIYTPIMILAMAAMLFLPKYIKKAALAIPIFTALNIYIIFSWWSWWYGGSYGARPIIDSYALLSIPLAAFIEQSFKWPKAIQTFALSVLAVLLAHGVFQTFQYYYGAIHWDSMTREAYIDSFGRIKPSSNFQLLISEPDYDSALKGKREKPKLKSQSEPISLNLKQANNDTLITLTDINVEDGIEFTEIFRDSITMPINPIVLGAKLELISGKLPNNLLFAISVHDLTDKVLFYRDITLSNQVINSNPIDWEVTIDCCQAEPVVLKIYLWSRDSKSFSIKNIKILVKGII